MQPKSYAIETLLDSKDQLALLANQFPQIGGF